VKTRQAVQRSYGIHTRAVQPDARPTSLSSDRQHHASQGIVRDREQNNIGIIRDKQAHRNTLPPLIGQRR
jgi:hypothetical protein